MIMIIMFSDNNIYIFIEFYNCGVLINNIITYLKLLLLLYIIITRARAVCRSFVCMQCMYVLISTSKY
jgi:hypothetical protein